MPPIKQLNTTNTCPPGWRIRKYPLGYYCEELVGSDSHGGRSTARHADEAQAINEALGLVARCPCDCGAGHS